jgi:hypothetical protein
MHAPSQISSVAILKTNAGQQPSRRRGFITPLTRFLMALTLSPNGPNLILSASLSAFIIEKVENAGDRSGENAISSLYEPSSSAF